MRQLVDLVGEVLLAQTYDPYGSVYASAGIDSSSFGFTGEMIDENGLVYLRARYYNPAIGRFFQRDTWKGDNRYPQSLNVYMYVEGNPVLHRDPSGHAWCVGAAWLTPKANRCFPIYSMIPFPKVTQPNLPALINGCKNAQNNNSNTGGSPPTPLPPSPPPTEPPTQPPPTPTEPPPTGTPTPTPTPNLVSLILGHDNWYVECYFEGTCGCKTKQCCKYATNGLPCGTDIAPNNQSPGYDYVYKPSENVGVEDSANWQAYNAINFTIDNDLAAAPNPEIRIQLNHVTTTPAEGSLPSGVVGVLQYDGNTPGGYHLDITIVDYRTDPPSYIDVFEFDLGLLN